MKLKKLTTLALTAAMTAASVLSLSAGNFDDDYSSSEGHGYTMNYGAQCDTNGGSAYTDIYPDEAANTSVYVAASLYVKKTNTAAVSFYASESWSDETNASVEITITNDGYIGYSTEGSHTASVQFIDSLSQTMYTVPTKSSTAYN